MFLCGCCLANECVGGVRVVTQELREKQRVQLEEAQRMQKAEEERLRDKQKEEMRKKKEMVLGSCWVLSS